LGTGGGLAGGLAPGRLLPRPCRNFRLRCSRRRLRGGLPGGLCVAGNGSGVGCVPLRRRGRTRAAIGFDPAQFLTTVVEHDRNPA